MKLKSKLIHPSASAPEGFNSLVTPVYRGSTTIFNSAAETNDDWDQKKVKYAYGLYGTPTNLDLAAKIAELENAYHCFLTPGGQASIAVIYMTFARPGGHILVPDNAYGPTMALTEKILTQLNVEIERYDPMIGGNISSLIRENTQLIWCESPGSVTMEIQDIPAIVNAAHIRDVPVGLDNTYAAGVMFDAFSHGIDISMQALTKYVGGHSDLLLGTITMRDDKYYQRLGETHQLLGMAVSPDDCSLALRGLQTLAIRLDYLEKSTLKIAEWLQNRKEVKVVLHPALPTNPGYKEWKRDFTGSASLFSVVFADGISQQEILKLLDSMKLFKIGFSWGGVTSLAIPCFNLNRRYFKETNPLIRINVGLEDTDDLISDLAQAFSTLEK